MPRKDKIAGIIFAVVLILLAVFGYHGRDSTLESARLDYVPVYSSYDRVATADPEFYTLGTDKVDIVKYGVVATHVRISAGPNKGREGWVPSEWIR